MLADQHRVAVAILTSTEI